LELGDLIDIAGVIATSVFSYLIWKATKQNAETATASYCLQKSIVRNQNEIEEALKIECRQNVFKRAVKAISKLFDILENNYCLDDLNDFHGLDLTDEELVKYFNVKEREKIKMAFNNFSELVEILSRREEGEELDLEYVYFCKDEMWELVNMIEHSV